jgi:hypothetical protein
VIPTQALMLMLLLSIAPGLGCNSEDHAQQLQQCEMICSEPVDFCSDFVYEDCISGCMDKPEPAFVDAFRDCVDCYASVQCDVVSFSIRCSATCIL